MLNGWGATLLVVNLNICMKILVSLFDDWDFIGAYMNVGCQSGKNKWWQIFMIAHANNLSQYWFKAVITKQDIAQIGFNSNMPGSAQWGLNITQKHSWFCNMPCYSRADEMLFSQYTNVSFMWVWHSATVLLPNLQLWLSLMPYLVMTSKYTGVCLDSTVF